MIALLIGFVLGVASATPTIVLNEATFRDRVYACWLGKNIGGTLGMPFEGSREMHELTFFTPVPEKPSANDDLDLQLLWLKALEEVGPGVTCRDLGRYWLKYVPVDWNEYGVGKANMRLGLEPPLSGHLRNRKWRDSNGAWIRSEIWACVAPGMPGLAAQYAWEDACVDHGGAEGTYAEIFTAALESAAFVEKDRDRLLAIALSYIPANCAVAKSVRAAMESRRSGLDWRAARAAVVQASAGTGWFMAPQNVAFTMLGWLYGEGDFGRSICIAVNCGDDTDCTGATLGSLWGILYGTRGIPEAWRRPVGEGIQNVAVAGFAAPKTIGELTDAALRATRRVLAYHRAPVRIADGSDQTPAALKPRPVSSAVAHAIWGRSPLVVRYPIGDALMQWDLVDESDLTAGTPRRVRITLTNRGKSRLPATVGLAIDGCHVERISGAAQATLAPGGSAVLAYRLTPSALSGPVARGTVRVTMGRAAATEIAVAIPVGRGVQPGDLALASNGSRAGCDSELDREPGCASRAIDGVLPDPDGFEGRRWHSALTPHPHWLEVVLPRPEDVARCLVHSADPGDYPVDFDLQAGDVGGALRTVREVRGNRRADTVDIAFPAVKAQRWRIVILRSASATYPNAAQIGEIELLKR